MSTEIVKQASTSTTFNFFDADQFAVMQRVSQMFSNSELVPEIYRVSEKNPPAKAIANCMIAIETAHRIGASPLMVMQNMYIVHGQPAWSAKFLTATVNGCGRYSSIKYRIRETGKSLKGTKYTDYEWRQVEGRRKKVAVEKVFNEDIQDIECIAYTTERGSDEVLESIPVTMEMAVKEGWYTKDGSKWQTMPKLMLQYRAVTFWTRAYAPELSMGIKTDDEILDIQDVPYTEVVSEKVKSEISENANKTEFSMDDEPKQEEKPSAITPNNDFDKPADEPRVGDNGQTECPI